MFASVLRMSVLGLALGLLAACAAGRAEDKKDEKAEKAIELNVGDTAPTFQLRDDHDKT